MTEHARQLQNLINDALQGVTLSELEQQALAWLLRVGDVESVGAFAGLFRRLRRPQAEGPAPYTGPRSCPRCGTACSTTAPALLCACGSIVVQENPTTREACRPRLASAADLHALAAVFPQVTLQLLIDSHLMRSPPVTYRWQCSGCGHRTNLEPGCKGYHDADMECNGLPCPNCGKKHYWTGSIWTGPAPMPTGTP